jgi:hypothetical protein
MDNWQSLGSITDRLLKKIEPEKFAVTMPADLTAALRREASKTGNAPETLITEAVRAYFGDAA